MLEDGLHVCPGKLRIAGLDGAEETLFGSEDAARAVHVDATAFQDDSMAIVLRGDEGQFQFRGEFAGDGVVVFGIGVFGPAVELPVEESGLAVGVADEDRAIIAGPTAVGLRVEEFDRCHLRAGLF